MKLFNCVSKLKYCYNIAIHETIGMSAKNELRLILTCYVFTNSNSMCLQEGIPSEEASTLQIGSVTFPLGQYTSPQLHPCQILFDQDGHQDSSSASL